MERALTFRFCAAPQAEIFGQPPFCCNCSALPHAQAPLRAAIARRSTALNGAALLRIGIAVAAAERSIVPRGAAARSASWRCIEISNATSPN